MKLFFDFDFFFIQPTDPTFRVEGDGKRNILLGWPYVNFKLDTSASFVRRTSFSDILNIILLYFNLNLLGSLFEKSCTCSSYNSVVINLCISAVCKSTAYNVNFVFRTLLVLSLVVFSFLSSTRLLIINFALATFVIFLGLLFLSLPAATFSLVILFINLFLSHTVAQTTAQVSAAARMDYPHSLLLIMILHMKIQAIMKRCNFIRGGHQLWSLLPHGLVGTRIVSET